MIKEKIVLVKQNMESACKKAGRNPKEAALIAVSKTKPVDMLREAYEGKTKCRKSWISMSSSLPISDGI